MEELNHYNQEELVTMVLMMERQLSIQNKNIEKLIEQVRIANGYRFGKHTETLSVTDGQLSFFDEVEAGYYANTPDLRPDDVLPPKRRKKPNGKREQDLNEFS